MELYDILYFIRPKTRELGIFVDEFVPKCKSTYATDKSNEFRDPV